jgi:hypothetical protein
VWMCMQGIGRLKVEYRLQIRLRSRPLERADYRYNRNDNIIINKTLNTSLENIF